MSKYVITLLMIFCLGVTFCLTAVSAQALEDRSCQYAAVEQEKGVFYAEQINSQEWQEWFSRQQDYVQKTQDLFKSAVDIEKGLQVQWRAAANISGNKSRGGKSEKVLMEIGRIVRQIEGLSPSEELTFYHEKIIAACRYLIKAIESYGGERSQYASYKMTSMTLAMDAMAYLKGVYSEHGASQQELDGLSQVVEEGFLAKK